MFIATVTETVCTDEEELWSAFIKMLENKRAGAPTHYDEIKSLLNKEFPGFLKTA